MRRALTLFISLILLVSAWAASAQVPKKLPPKRTKQQREAEARKNRVSAAVRAAKPAAPPAPTYQASPQRPPAYAAPQGAQFYPQAVTRPPAAQPYALFDQTQPQESDPQQIFHSLRPLVYQISLAVGPGAPKASYGTGFAVGPHLIATNYHVIAAAAVKPQNYQIFIHLPAKTVEGRIVDIDVVNDLSLVEVGETLPGAIAVRTDHLGGIRKGERIFSLGLPQDLEMSLVEGNFNGVLTDGAYYSLVLSSPLNQGMSGGPTVDRYGRLIGVNMSIMRNAQNLSFLASPFYLSQMINRYQSRHAASVVVRNWAPVIEQQLINVQARLTMAFLNSQAKPLQMGPWSFSRPPVAYRCWRDSAKMTSSIELDVEVQTCSSLQKSNPEPNVDAGNIEISYYNLKKFGSVFGSRSQKLEAFYNLVPTGSLDRFRQATGDKDTFTKHDCSERLIANASGVRLKVNYCVTGFKNYQRLNSAVLKIMTLSPKGSVAMMVASLHGFTHEDLKRLFDHMLNGVQGGDQNG